jgi:hypothetical protein
LSFVFSLFVSREKLTESQTDNKVSSKETPVKRQTDRRRGRQESRKKHWKTYKQEAGRLKSWRNKVIRLRFWRRQNISVHRKTHDQNALRLFFSHSLYVESNVLPVINYEWRSLNAGGKEHAFPFRSYFLSGLECVGHSFAYVALL